MRLVLLGVVLAGCKVQPVEVPPAPDQLVERDIPKPGAEQGGIALDDYGHKRSEPQLRPERIVYEADERQGGSAEDAFQIGYMLRESRPAEAIRKFNEAARRAPNDAQLQQRVNDQLALLGTARELYLRGYQLKNDSPDEAVTLFEQVLELTAVGDGLHEKAKAQLQQLGR